MKTLEWRNTSKIETTNTGQQTCWLTQWMDAVLPWAHCQHCCFFVFFLTAHTRIIVKYLKEVSTSSLLRSQLLLLPVCSFEGENTAVYVGWKCFSVPFSQDTQSVCVYRWGRRNSREGTGWGRVQTWYESSEAGMWILLSFKTDLQTVGHIQ